MVRACMMPISAIRITNKNNNMDYKDIISYELADGITEDKLLEVAKLIFDEWMTHQPGFIGWEIHSNTSGGYTDIVYWRTKEAAKQAEQNMGAIPHAAEWFACYKEGSINSQNLTMIGGFGD